MCRIFNNDIKVSFLKVFDKNIFKSVRILPEYMGYELLKKEKILVSLVPTDLKFTAVPGSLITTVI